MHWSRDKERITTHSVNLQDSKAVWKVTTIQSHGQNLWKHLQTGDSESRIGISSLHAWTRFHRIQFKMCKRINNFLWRFKVHGQHLRLRFCSSELHKIQILAHTKTALTVMKTVTRFERNKAALFACCYTFKPLLVFYTWKSTQGFCVPTEVNTTHINRPVQQSLYEANTIKHSTAYMAVVLITQVKQHPIINHGALPVMPPNVNHP